MYIVVFNVFSLHFVYLKNLNYFIEPEFYVDYDDGDKNMFIIEAYTFVLFHSYTSRYIETKNCTLN